MSLWREEKYLRLLAPQLDRFTQKHSRVFNFRCPLCGDSERFKTKARGYVYAKGQVFMFKCHNCSLSLPFAALLRRLDRRLYDEYLLEKLRDERPSEERSPARPAVARRDVQPGPLLSIADCATTKQRALYSVYEYVRNRQIPKAAWSRIAATHKANSWLRPLVGEKAERVVDDEPYLVLPLCLRDGTWYGAQVRHIHEKHYTTFRWSNEHLKVFGMDAWNPDKTTYLVEGPMDALCVPNALAACGSDLLGTLNVLRAQQLLSPETTCVLVWDNEPRNKEIRRHLHNAIKLRESVVIWPAGFPKDINDAVCSGIDVITIMEQRTFTGLMAELEYYQWQK